MLRQSASIRAHDTIDAGVPFNTAKRSVKLDDLQAKGLDRDRPGMR
jgi:hypothetical protein